MVKVSGKVMSVHPFRTAKGEYREVQIMTGATGTGFEIVPLCMPDSEPPVKVGDTVADLPATVSIYQGKIRYWSPKKLKAA